MLQMINGLGGVESNLMDVAEPLEQVAEQSGNEQASVPRHRSPTQVDESSPLGSPKQERGRPLSGDCSTHGGDAGFSGRSSSHDRVDARALKHIGIRLAAKHVPELKRLADERQNACSPLEQEELDLFGEAARTFFFDEAEFRSRDSRKGVSVRAYVQRLCHAGLEYSLATVRRRFVAHYVRERLVAAGCSPVNKLRLSQLVALDGFPSLDAQVKVAEAATQGNGLSRRQIERMVQELKRDQEAADETNICEDELSWTDSRISRRVTTVVRVFRKQFRGAPPEVSEKALELLTQRLSELKEDA